MADLYQSSYIHFEWCGSLEGKSCICSDSVQTIKLTVNGRKDEIKLEPVGRSGNPDKPFTVNGDDFRFCYYDPYLPLKLASSRGETIQLYREDERRWCDLNGQWLWLFAPERYRVKPYNNEVTNRDLSRWLVDGRGEVMDLSTECVRTSHSYRDKQEDNYPLAVLVRRWDDRQWHLPSRDYMEI